MKMIYVFMKIYLKIGDKMTLIRKIINWFKELFKKLFKHNNKRNKIQKENNIINKKNKNKASITSSFNDDMPSYMIINKSDKDKLLYAISLMKNLLVDNRTNCKEKDISEIINIINSKSKINKELLDGLDDNKKILNTKYLELLIKELSDDDKKIIIKKQEAIIKEDNEFKIHLDEIDKVIELINKSSISIISKDEINNEIDNIMNDKNINDNTIQKIDNFNKNVFSIIEGIDEYFLSNVVREYNKINYITIVTMIIDNNIKKYQKLEEDFKNHRYNKYYYEREINKIKRELDGIKNIKTRKDVSDHINSLKKELYTKSKDKYDLLYNNEIFMNMEKECDNLLNKINAKVIDIKKEKEEKKEEKEEKEDYKKKKYLENILMRFQDLEIARNIILLALQNDDKILNEKGIENYVNMVYTRYNEGLDNVFNYTRNKDKTELVVLYNSLNKAISKIDNEPYISIDHVNFRMNDLIEAVNVKKDVLNDLLKKHHIMENTGELIDDKISLLQEKDKKKSLILQKVDDKK